MNIDEPGTLLCIVVEEQKGQMKKIVDIVTEENISLGSVLVARFWDKSKKAIFPYLLTNNVINVKRKLVRITSYNVCYTKLLRIRRRRIENLPLR